MIRPCLWMMQTVVWSAFCSFRDVLAFLLYCVHVFLLIPYTLDTTAFTCKNIMLFQASSLT